MITIKNKEEMKKYYVKETNAYVFDDDVEFLCDIYVQANIKAWNIEAWDIKAWNIEASDIKAYDIDACKIKACDICAGDINAWDINADSIDYYAICSSYNSICCNSIVGRRTNSKHFVLDGELVVKGE